MLDRKESCSDSPSRFCVLKPKYTGGGSGLVVQSLAYRQGPGFRVLGFGFWV
jgi:hypothetical protein